MTVTDIKNSHGERYCVVFSDGSIVKTTLNVVLEYKVKNGETMDNERYLSFVSASQLSRALLRAMRIIGSRAMSVKELRDRLIEKGETEENAEACTEKLKELGYLNDADYGAMIVRHYCAKGYGLTRVKNELFRRGIERDLWEDALSEMGEDTEKIDKLLRSKLKSEEPDRAELKKASDFLLRRGFSYSDIKEAINRFFNGY